MKIFLSDPTHPSGENVNWQRALKRAFGNQFESAATENWDDPEEEHPAYENQNAIIFCHSSSGAKWRRKADSVLCHVILVRSAERQGSEKNKKGNLHGCHWTTSEFLNAKRHTRLQQFIEQLQTSNIQSVDWSLLQPGPAKSANDLPRSEQILEQTVVKFAAATCGGADNEKWLGAAKDVLLAFDKNPIALDGFFKRDPPGNHHRSGRTLRESLNSAVTEDVTPIIRAECEALLRAELRPEYARMI
jgi:hypothetical protein